MEEKKIIIDPATSFEAALAELEQLLAGMESGRRPLEELIASYERGMALGKYCREKLAALEKRIEIITADGGAEPFDPASAPGNSPR
ncbi:MAG: exodeoxyribonuclease VII small subunit [Victivallaceae bacterium]|nr:exodeoxyribonuclease VII small subunit [Victivallaceae bacterium]